MKFKKQLPRLEKPNGIFFITFVTWERIELTLEARQIVLDSCLFFHQERYYIFALVIMPDHVHLLLQPWIKDRINTKKLDNIYDPIWQNLGTNNIKKEGDCITEYWSIGSIMHSIKSYSAKQIPQVMKHIGKVWQDGRYDEMVRSQQEFHNKWEYIKQNSVKAGLSDTPEEYPFLWETF